MFGSNTPAIGGKLGDYAGSLGQAYKTGSMNGQGGIGGGVNIANKLMLDTAGAFAGTPGYNKLTAGRVGMPDVTNAVSRAALPSVGVVMGKPKVSGINTNILDSIQKERMGNVFLRNNRPDILMQNPALQQEMRQQAGMYAGQFGSGGIMSKTPLGGLQPQEISGILKQYSSTGQLTPDVMSILQSIYGG